MLPMPLRATAVALMLITVVVLAQRIINMSKSQSLPQSGGFMLRWPALLKGATPGAEQPAGVATTESGGRVVKIVAGSRTNTSAPCVSSCEVCEFQQATRAVEWQLSDPDRRDFESYGRFGRIPICERPQCAISAIEWLPPLAGSFTLVEFNGRPA